MSEHTEASAVARPSSARIDVITYGRDAYERHSVATLNEVLPLLEGSPRTVWIDIEGLSSGEVVENLAKWLPLHPMAADRLHEGAARSVVEDYGEHFLATMVFMHSAHTPEVIDFLFTDRLIVTVQERPGDCFDAVRDRLRAGTDRVRELGPQFLFALMGRAICNSYQPMLDRMAARVSKIETVISHRPEPGMLRRIHGLRARLMYLRQNIVPLRESITALMTRHNVSDNSTQLALRSLYDELSVLQDELDLHRDGAQRLADLYMNSVSNRLNDVMRVLAIISTIFMPLSFIASIYGMNFDSDSPWSMPELKWYYGYPLILCSMALVVVMFIVFFRRKGWIGDASLERRHGIDGLALDVVDFLSFRGDSTTGPRHRRVRRQPPAARARAAEARQ